MRLAQASRSAADVLAEKEAKLTAFITDSLLDGSTDRAVTLVIRSTDSPIARALASALAAPTVCAPQLRVVVLAVDSITEDHAAATALDLPNAEFRVLQDARFGAAHEQLNLGQGRVWIGDCMRRDPAKRDAFEIMHRADAGAAAHAERSFDRLWQSAKPMIRKLGRRIEESVTMATPVDDASTPTTLPHR